MLVGKVYWLIKLDIVLRKENHSWLLIIVKVLFKGWQNMGYMIIKRREIIKKILRMIRQKEKMIEKQFKIK